MKVLRYTAPRCADIIESERPVANGAVSIAKTIASNVSAGTEMAFYRGVAPQINLTTDEHMLFDPCADAITYPMQSDDPEVWWMGYAAVGRVVEVGEEESRFQVGDLVFHESGHKEFMASNGFHKLPEGTNPEHATLLSLIRITFNGVLDARIKLMDNVVIIGMGTVGQLLLQMSKLSGARVTVVDYLDSRLQLAKALGADVVFNPGGDGDLGQFVQSQTGGLGADVVFEASGNVEALPQAIRCAGVDGVVTVLSFYPGGAPNLNLGREFHHKRIALRSSQIGGIDPVLSKRYDNPRLMTSAIALLQKLNLEPLVSHRFQFTELPSALEMIDRDPASCQSIVVTY